MAQFLYVVDNYQYILKPIFRINSTRHIRVIGAELWGSKNLKYYGFWDRSNMPMSLVYQLEQRCRWLYSHAEYEIADNGYMRDAEKQKP